LQETDENAKRKRDHESGELSMPRNSCAPVAPDGAKTCL